MSLSRALLPLKGRHCLITGASGGIGAAIARRFAADGALITLTGRNESKLQKVLSDLAPFQESELSPVDSSPKSRKTPDSAARSGSATPLTHSYHVLDLTTADVTNNENGLYKKQHDVLDSIWNSTGQIDVLVNAAGIAQWQLLQKTPLDEAKAMLDTNLMGAIVTSRYIARQMKRRRADRDGKRFNLLLHAIYLADTPQHASSTSRVYSVKRESLEPASMPPPRQVCSVSGSAQNRHSYLSREGPTLYLASVGRI